jgi:phosphatidylserine decarboxylase
VVASFDTEYGRMAMVLVGAINVAAIETVWDGLVTPPKGKTITRKEYQSGDVVLNKGQEMGRFNMGSTVILVLESNSPTLSPDLIEGLPLKMGQAIS